MFIYDYFSLTQIHKRGGKDIKIGVDLTLIGLKDPHCPASARPSQLGNVSVLS